jgi:dethiobiotin synthetase
MNGYFVTGTDTDVGKTHVACALAGLALSRGHRVFAFKPIETGCVANPAREYVGADQERLAVAAGDWQRGPLRGAYRFALPAAPLVAAAAAQSTIDLALIERTARAGAEQGRAALTIVEGAGGWRVPITLDADMGSLARRLGLPVLVVARARLGTINHTLLTIEAVLQDGLPLAAVVLSQREEDDPEAARSNLQQIQRRWPGQLLRFRADASALEGLLPRPASSS